MKPTPADILKILNNPNISTEVTKFLQLVHLHPTSDGHKSCNCDYTGVSYYHDSDNFYDGPSIDISTRNIYTLGDLSADDSDYRSTAVTITTTLGRPLTTPAPATKEKRVVKLPPYLAAFVSIKVCFIRMLVPLHCSLEEYSGKYGYDRKSRFASL